jgi:hypothetical protein
MHIAVVGAGALGRIYGTRLCATGDRVTFVVRASRVAERGPIGAERVGDPESHTVIDYPVRAAQVPSDAEIVLVTVRSDQLPPADGGTLASAIAPAPHALVLVLTPMLPAQKRAMEAAVGRPIVAGMPGVSGYVDDAGIVRYWVPMVASTLIEDVAPTAASSPSGASLEAPRPAADRRLLVELARRLTDAGLPTRLEQNVDTLNAATSIVFFPLIAAIDAGGGIDAAIEDKELLELTLAAGEECDRLSRAVGKRASWAMVLSRFVGPFTLKAGIRLAKRLYPESVRFVDLHFGDRLHAQHLAMGEGILALGKEKGEAMPALERLLARVRRDPAGHG